MASDSAIAFREYTDQAIRCCIDTWNQLCPQHPLMNLTEIVWRKRWSLSGSDIAVLEQSGECGQISKITFGVSRQLAQRTFLKHGDQLLVTVDCQICWNCGTERVRGWSNCIVVDIKGNRVVQFPDVTCVTPHFHWYPLP